MDSNRPQYHPPSVGHGHGHDEYHVDDGNNHSLRFPPSTHGQAGYGNYQSDSYASVGTSSSHQGLQSGQLLPAPSFPDGHDTVGHYGHAFHNSTVSHTMNDPYLPSDTYNSGPGVSHAMNDPYLPSDTYNSGPGVSHAMNDPYLPSDTYNSGAPYAMNNPYPHSDTYNSTISHTVNDLHPPSDTYGSMVPHNSNNLHAPPSDMYYFMGSSGSNDLQPPHSDPIPDVTTKLVVGTRPKTNKTKRPSNRTKFLGSKYVSQAPPLSMEQVSSSPLIIVTPEILRILKQDARIAMFKLLFEENLFPSVEEMTVIATTALDKTVAQHSKDSNAAELVHWKSGSDGKNFLSRLKGASKEIHGDFEQVAEISWVSAYGLGHNLSNTKAGMQTSRVASLTALLLDFRYADGIFEITLDDGQVVSCRIPFAHAAILDLLEHILCNKQYYRYIFLDGECWIPRLTNAIALASTSRCWSLEKALAGPWSVVKFGDETNRARYKLTRSRIATLPEEERVKFDTLLVDMRRALE
ncbi:hypothetical protein DEU56DRAFT_919181 [Suillus clintonianus]|uniref:uncharacterized protein n=1 Tax=Suillus clintonianus TaxID=1904413 RepID=UPI001B8707D2|nr:uncharacterized protein DEU56DRAFT_919181 [Suillus clintonianus]KAG2116814.1 hypothetical protein DEU56DRAFT_919181 [Suillus clintonianus]